MGLFSKKQKDPFEMFRGQIAAVKVSWEHYPRMPVSVQRNAVTTMPDALRKGYRSASAIDATRARAMIDEARARVIENGPPSLPWAALLDYAIG
jgi:hypothetical protein